MKTFNPKIHHRRSTRLKGYDYSQAGAYFITICCQNMICRFGNIVATACGANLYDYQMQLNDFGQIAYNEWLNIGERFPHTELDVFQIMPNHMHGIIVLKDTEVSNGAFDQYEVSKEKNTASTIGDIVGSYKSLVANKCLKIYKSQNNTMGKLWQRNYQEHIFKNERSYQNISTYIIDNPLKWSEDKFYIKSE